MYQEGRKALPSNGIEERPLDCCFQQPRVSRPDLMALYGLAGKSSQKPKNCDPTVLVQTERTVKPNTI